jgi:diadenosine tetraphosphate (Ap4A) HIT family hydrolase
MNEIAHSSRVLRDVTRYDKLNVAVIGNVVPQLHVHMVARWKADPLWPKPACGYVTPRLGYTTAFGQFVAAIQECLGNSASSYLR